MGKMCLLFTVVIVCLIAAPVMAQPARHHIGLVLGYERLDPDHIDSDWDFVLIGAATYRYSISPHLDLAFDNRVLLNPEISAGFGGGGATEAMYFVGPGIRVTAPLKKNNLYLQGNFYVVVGGGTATKPAVDTSAFLSYSKDQTTGFGINAGIDFGLSRLLSLPIEVNYLYNWRRDDFKNIFGFGISTGLNFNFGMMP